MIAHIQSVHVGRIKSLASTISAIDKRPVIKPVNVGMLGLEGDQQADLKVHGGSIIATLGSTTPSPTCSL